MQHSDLTLMERITVESLRAKAMRPDTFAKYFARIEKLIKEYDTDAAGLLEFDKSGFIMSRMNFGKAK